ncbi:MAG TPA: aspartate aminotransferase family protein [Puia sp.]|nr:aspartate aminotransferase family protein [Puia sp.]
MNQRELFFKHLGQTSPAPIALEIERAEGAYLFDVTGKKFLDAIGGISVCNTGHRHPDVITAIKEQSDRYLHVLVYGELIQSPQVEYAHLLVSHLPRTLQSVYFTNSGAEATEGAMKLAKRVTGRTEIVAFDHSYHGSTQGALSLMGDEYWRNAFRPLLPGISHLHYNDLADLNGITEKTACVVAETIQAENGVIKPMKEWILALRKKCNETGALLILDEIQVGFGRTGTLWGFEQYGITSDILLLGKALGGGLPLGAFIASKELMDSFTDRPVLGHITTFGGHPLSCAAGLAAMNVLIKGKLIDMIAEKENLFRKRLVHPSIKSVRSAGLLIAVEFQNFEINKRVIDGCLRDGLLTDWFLFASACLRIAPPLTIELDQIEEICRIILLNAEKYASH